MSAFLHDYNAASLQLCFFSLLTKQLGLSFWNIVFTIQLCLWCDQMCYAVLWFIFKLVILFNCFLCGLNFNATPLFEISTSRSHSGGPCRSQNTEVGAGNGKGHYEVECQGGPPQGSAGKRRAQSDNEKKNWGSESMGLLSLLCSVHTTWS